MNDLIAKYKKIKIILSWIRLISICITSTFLILMMFDILNPTYSLLFSLLFAYLFIYGISLFSDIYSNKKLKMLGE